MNSSWGELISEHALEGQESLETSPKEGWKSPFLSATAHHRYLDTCRKQHNHLPPSFANTIYLHSFTDWLIQSTPLRRSSSKASLDTSHSASGSSSSQCYYKVSRALGRGEADHTHTSWNADPKVGWGKISELTASPSTNKKLHTRQHNEKASQFRVPATPTEWGQILV